MQASSRRPHVVDDEDVAGRGPGERLQEDVDAAVVAYGQCLPGDPLPRHDGQDTGGRGAQGFPEAHTGVGDERGGEVREVGQVLRHQAFRSVTSDGDERR